MNRVTKTNKHRHTGQQPGTKSGRRPFDKPVIGRGLTAFFVPSVPGHALLEKDLQRQLGAGTLVSSQERRAAVVPRINRGSTARCVPPSVYIGIPLSVLPESRSGQLSTMPRGANGTVVSCASRPVGVPPYPAPPRRPALRRPAPTPPWYVRVLGSIGFPLSVLPKDRSGQCLRCPGGQQGRLFPGRTDPSASRPALPRPAQPLRRAPPRRAPPRPDRPVACLGF